MFDPNEQRFLEMVREFAEIGYGRMLQIIKYEWSETHPERAAMEFPKGVPGKCQYFTVRQMLIAKEADPLAENWTRLK